MSKKIKDFFNQEDVPKSKGTDKVKREAFNKRETRTVSKQGKKEE